MLRRTEHGRHNSTGMPVNITGRLEFMGKISAPASGGLTFPF
jgi:hypothetical protein